MEVDGKPIILGASSISLSASAPGIKSLKLKLDLSPKYHLQLCPKMHRIGCMLNFDQIHEVSRKSFTTFSNLRLTLALVSLFSSFGAPVFASLRSGVRRTLYDLYSPDLSPEVNFNKGEVTLRDTSRSRHVSNSQESWIYLKGCPPTNPAIRSQLIQPFTCKFRLSPFALFTRI